MSKELFPHSSFGYRLEYKDGADKKVCWFAHHTHITKYIDRYKLKKASCKIDVHPDFPPLEQEKPTTKAPSAKKVSTTTKKPKQKLFADVDTYVKITPEAPKRTRKASKTKKVETDASECPRVLQDRFQCKKNKK